MTDLNTAQKRQKHIDLIREKINMLHETLIFDEANLHEIHGLTKQLDMLLSIVLSEGDTDD